MPALVLAQPRIAASLDTIAMTIGEDIQYQIEVQTDSTAQVIFPQGQTFLPFEIIDTTKVDIQKLADKALWKRTYTLIQFDSGSYHIPRQRIFVDGTPILTDSLKIEVFTVEVDTLKQPLHPIKPIIEIGKTTRVGGAPTYGVYWDSSDSSPCIRFMAVPKKESKSDGKDYPLSIVQSKSSKPLKRVN